MTKLKANGFVVSQNSIKDELLAGTIQVAISQNTSGIGASYTNPNIKVFYPTPSAALPSTIAIDAKASAAEIADAKKFADFVYSPAGQQVMLSGDPQGDSQFFPIMIGEKPRPRVPAVASIPFSFPNPYTWGPLEPAINTWFNSHVA